MDGIHFAYANVKRESMTLKEDTKMKNIVRAIVISVVIVFLAVGTSSADYKLTGYNNITAYDGYSSGTGWYGMQEDQETEPGTVTSQAWDLEGIYYNPANGNVAIVGGWDFKNGATGYTYAGPDQTGGLTTKQIDSGDVFIFNSLYPTEGYGIHLNFSNSKYSEFYLDLEDSSVALSHTSYISQSNPYRFTGGEWWADGILDYYPGLSDADVGGLQGGSHYMIVLNDLGLYGNETIHFTYECGNDMIESTPVPEPTTMLLLGLGLIGVAGIRRKFKG